MPTSLLGRSARLLGMASKLAVKELANKVIEKAPESKLALRIEQAKIITEQLSQLKGAAMKAGQLLSIDASDFLPPEALEILGELQASARPEPLSLITQILKQELSLERFNDIKNLSSDPIGTASIGQVHRATICSEEVAIKVQYPNVQSSIDSDLKLLETLAQSLVRAFGKKYSLKDTFNEIREVLTQETDYLLERSYLEQYRHNLESDSRYIVPKSLPNYSTNKVLTMTYEKGVPLSLWLKTSPSLKAREQVARMLLDLFCKEFVDHGLVQTDPNFANYLIQDGQNGLKLVLLDFGAALEFSDEFRRRYAKLLIDLRQNSPEYVFSSAVDYGLLDARESAQVVNAFYDMISTSLEPFHPNKQPFCFTDTDFEKRTRDKNLKFTSALVYSPPPRKILFLHRKLGGVFNFVKKLGVTLDLRPYWEQMTKTKA